MNRARYRAAAVLSGCALCIGVTQCGFPDYGYLTAAGGTNVGGAAGSGSPGDGGIAGALGGASGGVGAGGALGGQSWAAGAGGAPSDGGSAADSGAGGEAGAPPLPCVYPSPVVYPDQCFDRVLNGGETGVDCGGSQCAACSATETCAHDSDCASAVCTAAKTCLPIVSLAYTVIETGAFTRAPKFKLEIKYLDTLTAALQDLRIRYYFNHNGVAEPVIAQHTQATLSVGNQQAGVQGTVIYRVYRYPPPVSVSQGTATDSYLEISFESGTSLTAGATLDLTQDIDSGTADSTFQQATHYSYVGGVGRTDNRAITVFLGARRVWGVEPPMVALPDCAFAGGVNFGGSTVRIGSHDFESSAGAQVNFPGTVYQSSATPNPTTDLDITTLLRAGFTLGDQGTGGTGASGGSPPTATWPVSAGKYWAYAWLTSAGSASGQLMLEDIPADEFCSQVSGTSADWARIGPYLVDVPSTGGLRLTATGLVHVTGVELYRIAP